LGTLVPKEYGGGGLEANIVLENLSYGDVGIGCAIGASWRAQTVLLMRASQRIRDEWFPKLASTELAPGMAPALLWLRRSCSSGSSTTIMISGL
jgi:alkylation response protein AidB-like acyl-CoA dehydrogenase